MIYRIFIIMIYRIFMMLMILAMTLMILIDLIILIMMFNNDFYDDRNYVDNDENDFVDSHWIFHKCRDCSNCCSLQASETQRTWCWCTSSWRKNIIVISMITSSPNLANKTLHLHHFVFVIPLTGWQGGVLWQLGSRSAMEPSRWQRRSPPEPTSEEPAMRNKN